MINFGLVGSSLSHSFSKAYFGKKFKELNLVDHAYVNIEISNINELSGALAKIENLKGFNVTIPFKESILPLLDKLSDEAKTIAAVNCVKLDRGKLIGYNTDVYGFSQSIKPFLDNNHERALVLGTGGASKAVAYAFQKIGVEVYFVTSGQKKKPNTFFYDEINAAVMGAFKCIVNTTPLGMFPNTSGCPPLPYHLFSPQHLAYDLIYNPEQTLFLKQAREQGAIVVNGLSMLQLQAEKSWEIWNEV